MDLLREEQVQDMLLAFVYLTTCAAAAAAGGGGGGGVEADPWA